MHIIKLNATDSTNSYLRHLSNTETLEDYTVVVAEFQESGRGQMGTVWESEPGKNLMFSVLKDVSFLKIQSNFYISRVVSLALIKSLQQFSVPKLSIKWPNDILSENSKICGVLIENMLKQDSLKSTIIGIGMNVNQVNFNDLPRASSLKLILGTQFDLDELLIAVVKNLKYYFKKLEKQQFHVLKTEYENYLFRKDRPSTFQDVHGNLFSGYIKQVTESGCLQVLLEDDKLSDFDLKEITLLY
ncbi:biotin--[acetyl-CoA-carboxylase] ligase [Hanstruepera neustonica]|uniref:Biotin--[acetyl-CoA-carboxylase] ligase n=1 Tax=Hanstruepera neustonica TaxID=1445657 RepID=A0A2K1E0J3_9FLAO|nr:biotin--[acetyl-CoA-carboxylase] ligase [Hanstruepera neustonica]PNQ73798.1 biotin--[acetyl-CoA-carboxylase] ligase [Hanstruepera neustonica]